MGLQPIPEKSQSQQKQQVTTSADECLQTSLQTKAENSPKSTTNPPDDLAEIVTAWPELPEHIKAAIKALTETSQSEQKRE
jgi:hypothetical protein